MPSVALVTALRTAVRSGPCSTTTAVVSEASGKCAASRCSAAYTSVPGTVWPCEKRPPTVAASAVEATATDNQSATTTSGCRAHQLPSRCSSRVTGARLGGPAQLTGAGTRSLGYGVCDGRTHVIDDTDPSHGAAPGRRRAAARRADRRCHRRGRHLVAPAEDASPAGAGRAGLLDGRQLPVLPTAVARGLEPREEVGLVRAGLCRGRAARHADAAARRRRPLADSAAAQRRSRQELGRRRGRRRPAL